MQRLLHYIGILIGTWVVSFVILSAELYVFNAAIDYSVAAGTSTILAPLLTVFFALYLELFAAHHAKAVTALAWVLLVIAYGIVYALYPACEAGAELCERQVMANSVLFYGLPIAIIITLGLPVITSLRSRS